MSTDADQDWLKQHEELKAAFNRRFPDLSCLRCHSDRFSLRRYTDAGYFAIPAPGTTPNVAELICESCGFLERHLVHNLLKHDPGRTDG